MGNTTHSASAPPSPSQSGLSRLTSSSKQIHIITNHPDGFYFTGERLMGTVQVPVSFLHQHLSRNKRTPAELVYKRSLRSALLVELVGDATYSAQVDSAADSDGHATHTVNLCRERCVVSINPLRNDAEENTTEPKLVSTHPPGILCGTFQLIIPETLPPSLPNNRCPSVSYMLELSFSSSRRRYQIPLVLSSRGPPIQPWADLPLCQSAMNEHEIRLDASLARSFYRPGEHIPVQIRVNNPQQRFIRSIRILLGQFYRIHNDQHQVELDGKGWSFEAGNLIVTRDWTGDVTLQLPDQPLAASFSSIAVGTTQNIQCDLEYRIMIELNGKKGEDIQLTLPSIYVTYQQ